MSYISQMPLMWNRAAEDGLTVKEINRWYRVSLLRAQVRHDLDLNGQMYIAEHQTWASFWPGEPFPGTDPRPHAQAGAPTAASPATIPAAVVVQTEVTTSSTLLKDISAQRSPSTPLKTQSRIETPEKTKLQVNLSDSHNHDHEVEEEQSKGPRNQNTDCRHEKARARPTQKIIGQDKDEFIQLARSEPSPARVPDTETIICGNCSQADHSLADCTYNIDQYGYLNGCPRCNTLSHNYADCPIPRLPQDDHHYLITKRHGKPPLRCRWDFRLGYWKEFKDCIYEDDAIAMRPQTAAFAKERRDRGVVQEWYEIVLDPVWYGRTDWTTNVGKMVHPLDKEVLDPYKRQIGVSKVEETVLVNDEGGLEGRGGIRGGKRSAEEAESGAHEYGRLTSEESIDASTENGSVQQDRDDTDQNGEVERRPTKPTMKAWSRNGRKQDARDERSWKKRRLEDQQSQGDSLGQKGPIYDNDQRKQHYSAQAQDSSQQQQRSGFNNAAILSSSSTQSYHGENDHANDQTRTIPTGPRNHHERPIPYRTNENPSVPLLDQPPPPLRPLLPNGMTSRELGKQKANEARAKLGPLPGWKPWKIKPRDGNGSSGMTGSGGFQRGQQQTNVRPHRQNHNYSHNQGAGGPRNFNRQAFKEPGNVPQGSFDFRADPQLPTHLDSRPHMQANGPRGELSQNFNPFHVQQGNIGQTQSSRFQPVIEGPINPRTSGIITPRGQQNGDDWIHRRLNGRHGGQRGNQKFNGGVPRHETGHGSGAKPPHAPQQSRYQQRGYQNKNIAGTSHQTQDRGGPPPTNGNPGGYCVNCRSHGHVIEECEGSCGLCRVGGHKARECRFFEFGTR